MVSRKNEVCSDTETFRIKKYQIGLKDSQLIAVACRGLIVSGSIGSGKSVLAKYIAKSLMRRLLGVEVRVFDIVNNWRYNFDTEIYCQDIDDLTYRIYLKQNIVYDLNFPIVEDRAECIQKIVKHEFDESKNQKRINKGYGKWNTYVIEESNVILDTIGVRSFWLDFVNTARNYHMSLIAIMQRMADSSTKVIERSPNFAIGLTHGANDLRKIRAMLSKEDWETFQPNKLKKYEFLMIIDNDIFILKLTERTARQFERQPCKLLPKR